MLRVYRKGGTAGTLSDLGKKFVLIDVHKPTTKELNFLSAKTRIPLATFKEYIDPNERAKVIQSPQGLIVVLQAMGDPKHTSRNITRSVSIYLMKNTIILYRNHDINSLKNLSGLIQTREHTFPLIIDTLINDYFTFSEHIHDELEKIESTVIKHPKETIVPKIFSTKKQVIYAHKALSGNRDALSSLARNGFALPKKVKEAIDLNYHDTTQLMDMFDTNKDVLITSYEIYLSSVSNNMNKVMKTLTVFASMILFPTLIAAIYGMNFKHTPEFNWQYGYPFAIGVMIVSVLVMFLWFRKKGWTH